MKKVLVLTTTYPRWRGDTEPAFVHNLCRELAGEFEVTVLAPHASGCQYSEQLDGVTVRRFRYLPFGWQKLAYDGGIVPKLKQSPWLALQVPFLFLSMFMHALYLCRKENIHVIHAHWLMPQGLIAVIIKKVLRQKLQVITTSHGADLFSLKAPLLQKLKVYVIRHSDTTTVVSQAMRDFCKNILKVDKQIIVQSMGVDCQQVFVDRTAFSARSGMVFVGRLVEKKGCALLLEAFALLLRHYPDEKLTIVGDGFERAALEARVINLGISHAVSFIGAVPADQVAGYYNHARVAVMPSMVASDGDQEGLGLVAAEALACGCITITSDLPAVQDVHDQPQLQFHSGDADSLFQRLFAVYADMPLAQQLSSELQKRVLEKFDWQAVGQAYCKLMRE